jgi:hypothetical protein
MNTTRRLLVAAAALAAAMFAQAQAFPSRPVTLIVPFPAGGPSAALARAVAHPPLGAAVADPALRKQMQAVGVELPDGASPSAVKDLIQSGLRRDVPALKARGEYLD